MQRFSLLLALTLFGCPTPVPPGDNDGGSPLEFVGRQCNVDAECGTLRCDKVRRQCICLSDDSCKPNPNPDGGEIAARYCNNYTGLCVEMIAGCKLSSDCQESEYCDANTRACRSLKGFCQSCSADLECGGAMDNCVLDERVKEKFCGKACATSTDCARGSACVEKAGSKQCWPDKSPVPGQAASCKNFQGCVPDSLRTCNVNGDCGDSSQRCDPASGKCIAIVQVCPFGTTCDPRAKICVADCATDADCGDVKLRCTNRICEPVGECTTDHECPANKVCAVPAGVSTGRCVPFCQGDGDCSIGESCQKVNERYRCQPGCSTSSNCPLNQRCNAAKQCEGPTVGTARTCQATPVCNSCESCDLTKHECGSAKLGASAFPYCQGCSSPSECSGGTCVGLDDGKNYCARFCTSGQECPQGFVCLGLTSPVGSSACVPANRQCAGKCP
jgi:hypothetical protein